MTKEERAHEAVIYKHSGYNCCQAVINAFADIVGGNIDSLNNLASGFAAGMGGMEATCGALVGAVITAGLIKEGKGTMAYAREMHTLFTKKCGASICKELKGRDTGVMLCACDECVQNAVLTACEVLEL